MCGIFHGSILAIHAPIAPANAPMKSAMTGMLIPIFAAATATTPAPIVQSGQCASAPFIVVSIAMIPTIILLLIFLVPYPKFRILLLTLYFLHLTSFFILPASFYIVIYSSTPSSFIMEYILNGAVFDPGIPGLADGIPGIAIPLIVGFSFIIFCIASVGMCPSTT